MKINIKNKTKQLNEQNNLLEERLMPENQSAYTNMICYLRGAGISDYDTEIVRHDIIEMILSAQERNDKLSSLFQGNEKQFCDEIIENLPPKTKKQKLFDALNIICLGLSILFTINIIISSNTFKIAGALINKTPVNWYISVSCSTLIMIFLVLVLSSALVTLITKNAFQPEMKYEKNL